MLLTICWSCAWYSDQRSVIRISSVMALLGESPGRRYTTEKKSLNLITISEILKTTNYIVKTTLGIMYKFLSEIEISNKIIRLVSTYTCWWLCCWFVEALQCRLPRELSLLLCLKKGKYQWKCYFFAYFLGILSLLLIPNPHLIYKKL